MIRVSSPWVTVKFAVVIAAVRADGHGSSILSSVGIGLLLSKAYRISGCAFPRIAMSGKEYIDVEVGDEAQ